MTRKTSADPTAVPPSESRKQRPGKPSRIYFIQVVVRGGGGPIKIGTATNPCGRMNELQTGCPYPLELLHHMPVADSMSERDLHTVFAHCHMRGEWFRATDGLLEFIDERVAHMQAQIVAARESANP